MTPEDKKRGNLFIRLAIYFVVVVVLVRALIPTLAGSGPNPRAACAANLHFVGEAMAIYANQFNDRLPAAASAFGGSWMCDQPADFTEALAATSGMSSFPPLAVRRLFYCPANGAQRPDALWGQPGANYTMTGYVWTNKRTTGSGNKMPYLAGGLARTPPLTYHTNYSQTPNASTSELALDWIISDTSAPASANWIDLTTLSRAGTYGTNHIKGSLPNGANVLAFDGSVSWRPFDPLKAIPVRQGNGPSAPFFWFPNP